VLLLGIVGTCRAIGVPVQAYLTWAFEWLGTRHDAFPLAGEEPTPAAFQPRLPIGQLAPASFKHPDA
jgi:hypothetical protein